MDKLARDFCITNLLTGDDDLALSVPLERWLSSYANGHPVKRFRRMSNRIKILLNLTYSHRLWYFERDRESGAKNEESEQRSRRMDSGLEPSSDFAPTIEANKILYIL